MLSIIGCSGSDVVDVVVGDKRIVEVDDNSSRIDSVIYESSLVNDCDDFGGLLPSFYPEPERVLLFASWKGIIHIVGQEFEGGVSAFRIALAKYEVECDFAVNYLKNDATRVTAECMRTNPGSVFELDVDESSGCFRRLFVAFHGYLYGFQFCRPLLFVDGTFLKGRYKGHLLAATSKNGNQDCFRESYKESVYPVPSSERFDFDGAGSSIIKPPITKKQLRRNKKKMIPSRGENVKQIKYGTCLKYGNHNKKTCKAAI
ncbi:hypothetical protein ACSBR2_003605 [Camellia fascicularis]